MAVGSRQNVRRLFDKVVAETTAARRTFDPLFNAIGPGWRDDLEPFYNAKGLDPEPATYTGTEQLYERLGASSAANGPNGPGNGSPVTLLFHINHDIAVNENGRNAFPIYFSVQWAPFSNAPGSVVWKIDYTYADSYGRGAFDLNNASTLRLVDPADGELRNQFIEAGEADAIPPNTVEPHGIFVCDVARDLGDPEDTVSDQRVYGLYMGLHYYSDRIATPQRNYPFYVE